MSDLDKAINGLIAAAVTVGLLHLLLWVSRPWL